MPDSLRPPVVRRPGNPACRDDNSALTYTLRPLFLLPAPMLLTLPTGHSTSMLLPMLYGDSRLGVWRLRRPGHRVHPHLRRLHRYPAGGGRPQGDTPGGAEEEVRCRVRDGQRGKAGRGAVARATSIRTFASGSHVISIFPAGNKTQRTATHDPYSASWCRVHLRRRCCMLRYLPLPLVASLIYSEPRASCILLLFTTGYLH